MFAHCLNQGWIEVIVGGMFSGKSEELIRRVIRAKYAKQDVLVFNHSWDTRYSTERVVSHTGSNVDAILVKEVDDIRKKVNEAKDVKLIAIDEAQFFDEELVALVEEFAQQGKRVIVAGLDQNFKGEPFKVMMELLARAEMADKLNAICNLCGAPASKTQRIIDGNPAKYSDPIILVGASECYEPRCRKCHIIKK